MPGHIASIHFPSDKLRALVTKPGGKVRFNVEMLFTDERFDRKALPTDDRKIIQQVIDMMNLSINKASVNIDFVGSSALTGKKYLLTFTSNNPNLVEPSFTWRTQLVTSVARKLSEYGYEFASETRDSKTASFYFVERRAVLDEVYNAS